MFLRGIYILLLGCILLTGSAQPSVMQANFYIDPSNSESTQTGDIAYPFQNLDSAFNKAQEVISQLASNQPLEITFMFKKGTTLSLPQSSFSLNFDGEGRSPSSIKLTAYGLSSEAPTVKIVSVLTHVVLNIPKVNLKIENLNLGFSNLDASGASELFLIDGEGSEVVFNQCSFQDSNANLQSTDASLIRLKGGNCLIKHCEFKQLELSSTLIEHQGTEESLIKYELNEFSGITLNKANLIQVTNALSFDFITNKVEKSSGSIVTSTGVSNAIVSENTFHDATGPSPLYFTSTQRLIVGTNALSYTANDQATHEGFLYVNNFDLLAISNMNITGYSGLSPAISIAIEESYQASRVPLVMLQKITFDKNGLTAREATTNQGLSLVSMNLKQKALISMEETSFVESTLHDMRQYSKTGHLGASTFWIEAPKASLKIKEVVLKNNKADTAFSNLYVNVGDLSVLSSSFVSNGQSEDSKTSTKSEIAIPFNNFEWFGDDLTFKESLFQENYGDFGGAISIVEDVGMRVSRAVTIIKCKFIKNQAKSGGAIYTNVISNVLQVIQLEDNVFEGNQADIDPDFSSSPKISSQTEPRLFMEVISAAQRKIYTSGEFILDGIQSGENTGYSMEFYISTHRDERMVSDKKYYSTILVSSSKEGEAYVVQNLTHKLTEASFKLDFFSLVAPLESINVVRVVMVNQHDTKEQYSFEFKARIGSQVDEPVACPLGSIFIEHEKACSKCPSGTYSLVENAAVCHPCVTGADCSKGGNQVKVLPGFWVDIMESDVLAVYSCSSEERCTGIAEDQCAEGYTGPLCEVCDTQDHGKGIYRPFTRDTCKSCQAQGPWEIVADVVGIIAPIGVLLYTVYALVTSNNKKDSFNRFSWSLYCNLFISFMQNLFILGALGYIPLPEVFNYIVNAVANPSFALFGYLTCYFPSIGTNTSGNGHIGILGLFFSIPVVKIILVVLMVKAISNRNSFFRNLFLSLIWVAFLEAPGFVDFCLRFFDCKQVGNWVYSPFLSNMQCDSEIFTRLKTFICVPLILLITVVVPLMITYSLSRGSLRSDEVPTQKSLRVMILAKSADSILKSHRSWVFFYIVNFGRLGVLLLSYSDSFSPATFSAVALYYAAIAFLNQDRRIALFKTWRTQLLFVDALMVLMSVCLGFGISFVQEGSIRTWLLNALWAGNALYLVVVNLNGSQEGNEAYGKLREENSSSGGEEVEQDHHKHNPEQLDETA